MITSAQNTKIKHLRRLMKKSRLRREEGLFVIEGVRELEAALQNGFSMHSLFLCPDIFLNPEKADMLKKQAQHTEEITAAVYGKTAYRGTTEGVLAIMHQKDTALERMQIPEHPLFLVLESVEKPGNLGAVLRTADAVGAHAVLVCDPLTDVYNPNTIRASLGALFTVPTFACSSEQAYNWLTKHNVQLVAATCQASTPYDRCDYKKPTAFVLGSEDKGLEEFWRQKAHCQVNIPMLGRMDSLNVSVTAAVLSFEALRQRNTL